MLPPWLISRMVVFNNKLTKSKKVMMCFHKLVQTDFSTLLLKRKFNGARGLLGIFLI